MSQATAEKTLSVEEYLAFEARSKFKHEYIDGEIFLMAGVKRSHSIISQNISRHIGNKLENEPCEVHQGDIKVRVKETRFVYPDVIVACGDLRWDSNETVLLNPTVIFEVLSKSTEARDRGEKSQNYRQLESLTDYLLVSQKQMLVEHFIRQNDGSWKLIEYHEPNDKIHLASINCQLLLRDIYFNISLPQLKLAEPKSKNGNKRG